jgi:hypothetical protein
MNRTLIAAALLCAAGCCGNCPSNDTNTPAPTSSSTQVAGGGCCEGGCCQKPCDEGCCSTTPVSAAAPGEKGTVVEFDSMKSTAPAGWKNEPLKAKQLRYMQFRLPKVKDDPADAEVVIFKGIGGSAKANIDRWKGMFKAPEGKTIEDVAKVSSFDVGKAKVSLLDVSGTYAYKSAPFDPNAKTELRPNSRMLGVVFEGPDDVYHIRLVGYASTVDHYRKGFEEWLRNFK